MVQVFEGPSNALEWILLGSGLAAFAIFIVSQSRFFEQPPTPNPRAAFFQESNLAVGLIHCVGVLSRRTPSPAWAIGGIVLYAAATLIFLAAIEGARGRLLPRPFVPASRRAKSNTGIFKVLREPVYVSYSLALIAGSIATHSATLIVTSAIMITAYIVIARRSLK